MLKRLCTFALAATITAAYLVPQPAAAAAPYVAAEQWVIMDAATGTILAAHNAETPRAVASLTKVMTAVVAVERGYLDMPVTITQGDKVGESSAGLYVGDTVSVRTLLHGLLLPSGNDAAMALARAVGGSASFESEGAREQFVAWMNEKAESLGLSQTHFANPHGLDAAEHHSSALDLALLTRHALSLPEFREVFGAADYSGDGYFWRHGNRLPGLINGVVGGKTGWTDGCGRCLIEVVDVGDGREAIIVLLGSNLLWYDDALALTRYARTIPAPADSVERADAVFTHLWARTDSLVASKAVNRTWLWGHPFHVVAVGPSDDSRTGLRYERLYEKGRMEVNLPYARMDGGWYITPGLLAVELIEGGADIPLAGDLDVAFAATYADLAGIEWQPTNPNLPVSVWLSSSGDVVERSHFAGYGVTSGSQVPETGHRIASVFEEFMARVGPVMNGDQIVEGFLFDPPLHAVGYPITEPFWVTVSENDVYVDVLLQCFERRCLTYTPSHQPAWQVEMSNIGTHYAFWQDSLTSAAPASARPRIERRFRSGGMAALAIGLW